MLMFASLIVLVFRPTTLMFWFTLTALISVVSRSNMKQFLEDRKS